MDPTALAVPWFASGVVRTSHDYNTLEYYCNSVARCSGATSTACRRRFDPIYWTAWNGQQYVLFDNCGTPTITTRRRPSTRPVSGRLQAPYAEEIILAYETQLAPQTSIELTYVNKSTHDIIEDTCIGNAWAYGPGCVPEPRRPRAPGPPARSATAGCSPTGRACSSASTRATSRASRRARAGVRSWSATPTPTRTETTRAPLNWSYASGDADWFPLNFYNLYGTLTADRDHRIKLNGYFVLPHRWTIGYHGFWSSPGHQTLSSTCSAFIDAPDSGPPPIR